MKKTRSWLLAFVVTAAAGAVVLQNRNLQTDDILSSSTLITTSTETITPTFFAYSTVASATRAYEGCSFMWAVHNDPELTEKVDSAIKLLDATASARADLYGEDCIFEDGHAKFSVMETDFFVHSNFDAVRNEEAFGNWIKQVMDVILEIPHDQVQGPRDGFVQFTYLKGEVETPIIRVVIQKYRDEAQGKTGTELFQFFQNSQ